MKYQKHNPKQIPPSVLYFLLTLLGLTWLLCYESQLKIPSVKNQELIGRLRSPNITIEQLSARIDRMYGRGTSAFEIKNKTDGNINYANENHSKNNNISDQTNPSPCVILNHQDGNNNWFGSVLSIISQSDHVPSFSLYYINNMRGSLQVQSYLSANDIHSSHVYFQSLENKASDFFSLVEIAKSKCLGSSVVVFMDDTMMLTGEEILKLLQARMQRESGVIGYGVLAVINRQRNKIFFGQSYPYPQQIVNKTEFKQYPFIVNGPLIVTFPFLKKITCKYCKALQNGLFSYPSSKAAVLLQMLENAEGKIIYTDDVLAVENQENSSNSVTGFRLRNELLQIWGIK